ncbi:uncharacterized protein F4807DRAFT_464672 [Annulohypoxylon truncatum]|uniref:uncharacterized protein n=1 Tax=Annulohypoxylon truncatum TaxID=327061 RepID=UPI0020078E41|nr:uncharacterized protein F4807DRAFT_464672 [Annulohypoxylon truncatum]KAI1205383.1 hypothetical protein F4807DRAFT_464672 [Annulohypoxylon truncatum]
MDDSVYVHHPRSDQMRHSLSRDSSMPEDRRSIPSPSSSAYTHDIPTTYASVPSFSNYPVPYDSSLPTPVSVAGSPSMNERTSKMMHSYNQHRAGSQQPTPPNTSRPWPNYQMNAATDLLEMSGLEASHSPDHSQLVSEPQFHQWGHYTVSSTEAPEELPPHMSHPSMFSVAPTELVRPSLSMHPSTTMPLSAPSSQIPILHHSPDPRDLAPSVTPIDNMHHQYPHMMHHQPQVIVNYEHYGNRRKASKIRNGRSGRPPKRQRGGSRALSKNGATDYMDPQLASSGDGAPSSKVPGRHIKLRPDAPEKDRYILELRCQMDNDKGKGIWEEITKKYEERYGKRRQESLQMNLTRAVLKYAEWPEEEDEALKRAVEELDRRRYSDIAKLMKEKYGGCQAWEWKDGHILKRLMELGIEEFDPEDITKKPRRKPKKAMSKRPGSKQPWVAPNMPLYSEDGRIISSEQENYILENYCKPDPDSPDPNAMQGVMEHPNPLPSRGSIDRDPGESRSERVAKQACEQLLSKGGNHVYGALPVVDSHP